jgi:hypothetical protein
LKDFIDMSMSLGVSGIGGVYRNPPFACDGSWLGSGIHMSFITTLFPFRSARSVSAGS